MTKAEINLLLDLLRRIAKCLDRIETLLDELVDRKHPPPWPKPRP